MDLAELSDISAAALVKGTKADLEFLPHLNRVSRMAVVSDKQWPRALFGFMANLLGSVEINVFGTDHREQAMQWAAQLPEKPAAGTPAIRIIETGSDDVLAFEMNGVVSADDLAGVMSRF
ncbi:MAG: STAS/SEC14 domain-containing protein, partial [Desulfosarcina sp.]